MCEKLVFEFKSSILDNPRNNRNLKKASGLNEDCNMDNNASNILNSFRELIKKNLWINFLTEKF